MERLDAHTQVYSTLERLRPRDREFLELRVMQDVPTEDIAVRFGMTKASAEVAISRAKARFREAAS